MCYYLLLPFFLILNFVSVNKIISQDLTVNEVINKIKNNVTCEWRSETVDNIKVGSGETKVTGIATTFMATMDILKKAVEENCNLIITHEPTFYNHFDDQAPLQNDVVQKAKLKFIEDNNLTIFRFHDHIHMTSPDGITEGVVQKMNWEKFRIEKTNHFTIPSTSLKSLADEMADIFNSEIIRAVGDPNLEVKNVRFILGAAGSGAHFNAFMNEDFDVLVVGEAREWETIPYVKDATTMNMNKGLIVLGHADSEEAGMKYCAEWLSGFISEVPIKFIPAGNPFWTGEKK